MLEMVRGVQGGFGPTKIEFVRNLSTGLKAGGLFTPFRVPAGRVLVITDADWQYTHPQGKVGAGLSPYIRLFIHKLGTDEHAALRVFESTITLDLHGQGGISESMTSGFAVAFGARIGADMEVAPFGPPSGLQHMILRGYLTNAGTVAARTSRKTRVRR